MIGQDPTIQREGYDRFGRPLNSLSARMPVYTTASQFDATTDSGIVTNTKINVVVPNNTVSYDGVEISSAAEVTTIASSELQIDLNRTSNVLFLLTLQAAHSQLDGDLDMSGRVIYTLTIDNVDETHAILVDTFLTKATQVRENVIRNTYSVSFIKQLKKNNDRPHTVYLRVYISDTSTNLVWIIHKYSLSYVVL